MNADRVTHWLFGDRMPVTKLLIVINAATFIGHYLVQTPLIVAYGGFSALTMLRMPWTTLTYPLVGYYGCPGGAVFSLAFACYWLWIAGGSLERAWGSRKFAIYFAEATALTAVGVYAAFLLSGKTGLMWGLWPPLAAVTVAFAALNPEEVILLMFVLPMKLKYVGMLSVAALLVAMARFGPLVGIGSLLGCAFSWWYVRTGHQYGGGSSYRPRGQVVRVHEREGLLSRLNPLKQLHRRRSEKRLRKLFEDSGLGEDERR